MPLDQFRRREFITLFGSAAATLPLAVGATPIPVIGLFNLTPLETTREYLAGFHGDLAGVAAQRLELLLELMPAASSIAYLRNPANAVYAETETRELQVAAGARGVRLLFVNASNPSDIETAFANLVQQADVLLVSSDGFLHSCRKQIVALAAHHMVPAIYGWRAAGGLISYGTVRFDTWRQAGVWTDGIQKGEKPAELQVAQSSKFELVINLKTVDALMATYLKKRRYVPIILTTALKVTTPDGKTLRPQWEV